jgi:predicted kinase
MRGIPGSGKSTYVRETLWGEFEVPMPRKVPVVCSADDFHMVDGEYKFDPNNIRKAHRACLKKFIDACTKGSPLVIVDNTNTQQWEYVQYVNIAQAFEYDVKIVEFRITATQSYERNIHKVPLDVIEKMYERFQPVLPWHESLLTTGKRYEE